MPVPRDGPPPGVLRHVTVEIRGLMISGFWPDCAAAEAEGGGCGAALFSCLGAQARL